MASLELPIRAATEIVTAHGITPDRCDILQNSSTLVLRLTETLVARVVVDVDGPRKGTDWFARENALAQHLTQHGAPVIPLHPDLPAYPYEHLGFALNFWQYVQVRPDAPDPAQIGSTLFHCHDVLRSFPEPLPKLAILTECFGVLKTVAEKGLLPPATIQLLHHHLSVSLEVLQDFPNQPLHGDSHGGNLLNTDRGLLWTDWEDTFDGPVEWDLASIIWNAQILEEDHETVTRILNAYREAGGQINANALHHSLIARAAVMTAWYPILYPNPNSDRRSKLQRRIEWLERLPE